MPRLGLAARDGRATPYAIDVRGHAGVRLGEGREGVMMRFWRPQCGTLRTTGVADRVRVKGECSDERCKGGSGLYATVVGRENEGEGQHCSCKSNAAYSE